MYIYNICGHKCQCGSSYNGHCVYSRVHTSSDNSIRMSSFTECAESTSGYAPIYLVYGRQSVSSVNSSNNNCQYHSGGIFISMYASDGISYNNFVENVYTGYVTVYLDGDGSTVELYSYSCNVIGNTGVDTYSNYGCIYTYDYITLNASGWVIKDNKTHYYLLYAYDSTIILSECYIDNNTASTYTTRVEIQSTLDSTDLLLTFISTELCNGNQDIIYDTMTYSYMSDEISILYSSVESMSSLIYIMDNKTYTYLLTMLKLLILAYIEY